MDNQTIRRWIGWSLLAGALACNAAPLALAKETEAPPAPSTAPTAPHRDEQFHVDMKQAVTYLASDELEGRRIGTPGLLKAADYIADAFAKLGLQAAPGLDGYFQPFTMTTRVEPDPQKTSLAMGS